MLFCLPKMTELVVNNQLNSTTEAELPVEKVEFENNEIVHAEPVMPKVGVEGAVRQGVLAEDHTNNIQAVGGQNVEAEALKVLPQNVADDAVIKDGDADQSGSWLAVLRSRVAKLKGVN